MTGLGVLAVVGVFSISGIETPEYEVTSKEDGYEIRAYAPQLVAEVTMTGAYRQSMNGGFRKLADFIFGNNQAPGPGDGSEEIAMTAPVLEREASSTEIAMTAPVLERETEDDRRVIAFVMPSQYTLETIPKPNNSDVRLVEVPSKTYAVCRFSGWVGESKAEKKKKEFAETLARDKRETVGEPILAQYNPPWTPPFMRRNEILVELAPDNPASTPAN